MAAGNTRPGVLVPVAPESHAPDGAGQAVWILGSPADADLVCRNLSAASGLQIKRSSVQESLARAEAGDWAVLTGLDAEQTVTLAEALLAAEIDVLVDTRRWPALKRGLAERRHGLDCVALPARDSGAPQALYRLRDVVAASLGLVVLGPVMGVLALVVALTSAGPAVYRTTVIGWHGKPFTLRKLRSMRLGAPEADVWRRETYRAFVNGEHSPNGSKRAPQKIIDESRITAVGRFLRRHSLDELPQIWNVLTGTMSVVGPRPCLPYEYEVQAPWHRLRNRIKPGLTGPWQAYGRSSVTFDEMALIDYCYTRSRSFARDLRLIFRTVLVVISGEGGK